jgi:transcriptional regulator with XRE-family HTH domain
MRKIGENIRFYRNLRGLTQTALARKVQVAPAYISQIEANQRVPSLKVTRRIAAVLGIDMSILVREADPRAQEGRLSVSEKLDLLRTLIMAIEGESRSQAGGPEAPSAEGRGFVATEIHSEPAYCVVLREFTSTATFGREGDETTGECHFVVEGKVRVLGHAGAVELEAGESRGLAGGASERLSGSRGARVLSIYAPRMTLAALAEQAAESEAPSA